MKKYLILTVVAALLVFVLCGCSAKDGIIDGDRNGTDSDRPTVIASPDPIPNGGNNSGTGTNNGSTGMNNGTGTNNGSTGMNNGTGTSNGSTANGGSTGDSGANGNMTGSMSGTEKSR